jgi:hypothetical protein
MMMCVRVTRSGRRGRYLCLPLLFRSFVASRDLQLLDYALHPLLADGPPFVGEVKDAQTGT